MSLRLSSLISALAVGPFSAFAQPPAQSNVPALAEDPDEAALRELVQEIKEEGAAKEAAQQAKWAGEREARNAAGEPEEYKYDIDPNNLSSFGEYVEALLVAMGATDEAAPAADSQPQNEE